MQADHGIPETVEELRGAVKSLDRARVNELSARLIAHARRGEDPFPFDQAKKVLDLLRRKRFLSQMQRVADAVIQSEQTHPRIRRQYAQALIDQGALTAAAAVLLPIPDDEVEGPEARGLLGRIHKQRYVDAVPCAHEGGSGPARNARALDEAIRWYHQAYLDNPTDNYWHGINAVACAARARRDGVTLDGVVDPNGLAETILKAMKARADPNVWELATAIEAAVALGDDDTALARTLRYIGKPDADAFEIASTLRQLEEVWCLDSTRGIGKEILPHLRGALLKRETGAIEISPAEVREAMREPPLDASGEAEGLEKNFGDDGFTPLQTYLAGARRAHTVARISKKPGGLTLGTGFLMRGCDLADRFSQEEWLLLTNAHVISTEAAHAPAMSPDEAFVSFEAHPPDPEQGPRSYRVQRVLAVSGPRQLDFAVVKLKDPVSEITASHRCDVAQTLPKNDQKGRTYIIGHPSGRSLSFSINDNLLLDYDEKKLHYRTPTEPGSSGSPVYDTNWHLIGLHHSGSKELPRLNGDGTHEANEGIRIHAIRRALDEGPAEGSPLA